MTAAEAIEGLGLAGVWLLGLSMGLTACTVSCLPFVGTWVFGRAGGARGAAVDAALFVAGRVFGYSLLGAAAGLLGRLLVRFLEGGAGHVWIGIGAVAAAVVLFDTAARERACASARMAGVPPFLIGASMTLIPCAPLASLVAAAALTGDGGQGLLYGLLFGLGAAVTPLFLVLPVLGAVGRSLRREQPSLGRWLRWAAAVTLLVVGGRELFTGVDMISAALAAGRF